MTIYALDIPDDPARLPGWLDRHLVGLDLAALVAELEAVHGPPEGEPASIRRELGDRLDAVLAGGLGEASPGSLRLLLRRPRLLLELQELVLVEGGPYWRRLGPPSPEHAGRVERGLAGLRLDGESAGDAPGGDTFRMPRPARRHPAWLATLATAAALVAFAAISDATRRAVPEPWGWDRPGATPQGLAAGPYLDRLADAAGEWFDERPTRPLALARRLAEFRRGCSTLILGEHRPLSEEDRAWLVERCRAWAAKIDGHLAAVEAGEPVAEVRAAADATARALIEALRARTSRG